MAPCYGDQALHLTYHNLTYFAKETMHDIASHIRGSCVVPLTTASLTSSVPMETTTVSLGGKQNIPTSSSPFQKTPFRRTNWMLVLWDLV